MVVVAEGLEKPEEVAFLHALDCDLGQGYLFSRPLAEADAEKFAIKGNVAETVERALAAAGER